MAELTMYGIPNCGTVKKARTFLEERGIDYVFHDYRKNGLEADWLAAQVDDLGWEALLNKRGMTWRKLDDAEKDGLDRDGALKIMLAKPAIIKRPLLVGDDFKQLGFDENAWEQQFS